MWTKAWRPWGSVFGSMHNGVEYSWMSCLMHHCQAASQH